MRSPQAGDWLKVDIYLKKEHIDVKGSWPTWEAERERHWENSGHPSLSFGGDQSLKGQSGWLSAIPTGETHAAESWDLVPLYLQVTKLTSLLGFGTLWIPSDHRPSLVTCFQGANVLGQPTCLLGPPTTWSLGHCTGLWVCGSKSASLTWFPDGTGFLSLWGWSQAQGHGVFIQWRPVCEASQSSSLHSLVQLELYPVTEESCPG